MPSLLEVVLFVSLNYMTYKHFRKIQIIILILLTIFIFNKNFQLILKTRIVEQGLVESRYGVIFLLKNSKSESNPKEDPQKRLFNPWNGLKPHGDSEYIKEKQSKSLSKYDEWIANGIFWMKRLIDSSIIIIKYMVVSVKDRYYLVQNLWQVSRQSFLKILEEYLDARSLPLAKGLLFGDISGIDRETYHSFKVIGILHILSASGANFILVLQFCLLFFKPLAPFLARKQLFYLHFCLATLYFALVGGGSAPSRAYLSLIFASYFTFWQLRSNHGLFNLFLVGFLILIINPFQLTTLGFQLSFLASFGLLFFGNAIENNVFIKKNYLLSSISMTASAQFFLVPVLVNAFAELNYLTFLANLLVLPLVEILTILFLLLYIAIFIEFAFSVHFFAQFLVIFISKIVDILFTLINFLNKIPYRMFVFEERKDLYSILFILIAVVGILVFKQRKKKKYSKNIYRVFR